MSSVRPGVRLGIDVGRVRVGVARSDPDGILATPVETVPREGRPVARIAELAFEHDAIEVLVGLPIALSGRSTASTEDARSFGLDLARSLSIPVRMIDERLSTVSAQAALRQSGRTTRNSRAVVDQVAAVIILQNALDFERSADTPAGVLLSPDEGQA